MAMESSSSSSSSSPNVGPWHDLSVSLAILLRVLLQQDADLASLTPQLVQIRRGNSSLSISYAKLQTI